MRTFFMLISQSQWLFYCLLSVPRDVKYLDVSLLGELWVVNVGKKAVKSNWSRREENIFLCIIKYIFYQVLAQV